MALEQLGARFCNLVPPNDPNNFDLTTSSGTWQFAQEPNYNDHKSAIENGQIGATYVVTLDIDTSTSRDSRIGAAIDEMLAISLGASYLTGMTVAPFQDLPFSVVKFLQYGDHFPRPRAMGFGWPLFDTLDQFVKELGVFVEAYQPLERSHNARLLIHHWLDSLAFWSLEDLTLSASTILEIISATAQRSGGAGVNTFNKGLEHAASQYSLPQLSRNFRNMRNDLVHEGHLSGSNFPNKDIIACAQAAASALEWIDVYICKVFGLTLPRLTRFGPNTFVNINAFSLD